MLQQGGSITALCGSNRGLMHSSAPRGHSPGNLPFFPCLLQGSDAISGCCRDTTALPDAPGSFLLRPRFSIRFQRQKLLHHLNRSIPPGPAWPVFAPRPALTRAIPRPGLPGKAFSLPNPGPADRSDSPEALPDQKWLLPFVRQALLAPSTSVATDAADPGLASGAPPGALSRRFGYSFADSDIFGL
jgi:hypothetical protein